MVTIKHVAARAGVGVGTASRVLSGSTQVSADSRRRVLDAATALNYVANGPARSLRRSRTDVLGLIVSDIRNPFFSELAHAAEQEADRLGFTVLFANANEDQAVVDEYLHTFTSQRIDGLLLSPQGGLSPRLTGVVRAGLPLVLLNRLVPGLNAPMYGTDNVNGVAAVLDWLQRGGHRDVAFVGGPPTISTAAERLTAYLAGRESHGISADVALLDAGDFQAEGGKAAMMRVLDRVPTVTAVVGANGPTTLGVIRALRERLGQRATASIDVASLDDVDWFEFASPAISGVRNNASEIGRLGVSGLVDLIEGRDAVSTRIPTTFIDRTGRDS